MRLAIIVLTIIVSTIFAFEFSIGAFEYQTGPSMYAKFEQVENIGPFELGIRNWIFWRAYDFGFYNFPERITPFKWESRGVWYDVWVKLYFTKNFSFMFLHRSEHNLDGIKYLNIHWYNFFELSFEF